MTQTTHYPRLRRWRRAAAFRQKEIARLIGIRSANYVSRIEQSERIPHLTVVIALEVLTGMSLAELMPLLYEAVEEETLARATAMLMELEEGSSPVTVMKCSHLRACQERVLTRHKSRTMHVHT
jgi:transcriptional regulator with XRE-family HTH domain